jgi:hypothetical protein
MGILVATSWATLLVRLVGKTSVDACDLRRNNLHLFGFDPIRHPAKHSIEYLMRKVHGFLSRGAGRDHADIDLLLSRKNSISGSRVL